MPYKHSINLINENEEFILRTRAMFQDEISIYVYDNIIRNRKYNYADYRNIREPSNNQYFVKDIINFGNNEVFVDAGVYDGKTSLQFARATKDNFKFIYGFEPDKDSYENSLEALSGLNLSDKIVLYKYGLWNKKDILRFDQIGDIRSRVSEIGNTTIEAVALDEIIDGEITYIKMDLEGSEMKALLGSKNIIAKYKPKLAISIYHKTEDLWELPLFIKELVPEYKFYIRHHSPSPAETVLYAVL